MGISVHGAPSGLRPAVPVLLLSLLALSLVALGADPPAGTASHRPLRLVDDRGEAVDAPLELCWSRGLSTACEGLAAGAPAAVPSDADSVAVEGLFHGPVRVQRRDLERAADGSWLLRVPRKVRLVVEGTAERAMMLSLYDVASPDFRRPAWQHLGPSRELDPAGLWVPSGRFVLSLSSRGQAPDLHLLELPPGERVVVRYRQRTGWSLLLRAVAEAGAEPVVGARFTLRPMAGYGDPARTLRAESDGDGLVVFNGLGDPLLQGEATHPAFVPRSLPGLTATPGSFGFEEVGLAVGGTVVVQASLEGEPLPAAVCRLRAPFRPRRPGEVDTRPAVYDGRTDARGRCRAEAIPQGPHFLEVLPGDAPHHARWVQGVEVVAGAEVMVEAALTRIRVHGTVTRGGEPVPGYRVRLQRRWWPGQTPLPEAIEVDVDGEGRYEAILWEPGTYAVILRNRHGTSAGGEERPLSPPEEVVDFELAPADLVGVVVDEEGESVAGAAVALRWPRDSGTSHRAAFAGEQGEFAFPLDDRTGRAEIRAFKEGYVEDRVEQEVLAGTPAVPVRLVLRARPTLSGTVLAATGAPLAGISVSAYGETAAGEPVFLATVSTDPDGRFELARDAGATKTRLFVTGPGCPLTAAEALAPPATVEVRCSPFPAALRLTVRQGDGTPKSDLPVLLRQGGTVVPPGVLRLHQEGYGLAASTDGGGRLTLVGLDPSTYDLYRADRTDPQGIQLGFPHGYLASVPVGALEAAEVEVTVDTGGP